MNVIIDSREQSRIKTATDYYNKQGLEVKVAELQVGDYLFDNKVCFEFKTIADFITSIGDHRVFNQAVEMNENYDYTFVIIYGTLSERTKQIAINRNFQDMNLYHYIGAINSLNRYTTVIQVFNPSLQEAYYTMQNQARKCLQNRPIVKKLPKKHKNTALNFLTYSIYGINYKKAKQITDTYDLHSLNDLFNLTHDKLTEIDGIGPNTANKIIEAIHGNTN